MQQRSELPRCLPSCCLPHALQPLGHGCPLPSAVRAWPLDVGVDTRWARLLPSRLSAGGVPLLFESFIATTSSSGCSAVQVRGLRLSPPGCHFAAGAAELSRFSCGEFPDVHGFCDCAGFARRLR